MARDYLDAVHSRVVVYHRGMGATLEQFDLTPADYGGLQGKCHEALVLNRPDVIEGVHTAMLEAGAEVLETDTFQASRLKLSEWGLEQHTFEINQKAAEIARKAAGENRFVAGSIVGLQEFGLGLAVAVLVDATLIRALLVPAMMAVLGRWNWWLPESLARIVRVPASPLTPSRPAAAFRPAGR